MRISNVFFLAVTALLVVGCFNYTKFLSQERSMLNRVSRSNLTVEQKLDSLLASSVRLMDASLKPINPVKGGKLVSQYYKQNEAAMQSIISQVNGQFSRMSLLEQGIFTARFIKKPYGKQFAKLYPKFKKKYKQVKAAAKFIAFFGKAFGKMGKLIDLLG